MPKKQTTKPKQEKETTKDKIRYRADQKQELRERLRDQAIEAIKSNKFIYQISDVMSVIGCSTQTWYSAFTKADISRIPEYQEIQAALTDNRILVKAEIRERMLNNRSAAALIALYRLIGTKEDREALNMNMDLTKAQEEKIDNTPELKLQIG